MSREPGRPRGWSASRARSRVNELSNEFLGDQQVKEADMLKLLEALAKHDGVSDEKQREYKELLESAKRPDGTIDTELVQHIMSSFLQDTDHMNELASTIGDFEIRL